MTKGVSIVICCYNSAKLLPETLGNLLSLSVPQEIPYELLIIDNNSSDNTAEIAGKFFRDHSAIMSFRILNQPVQGLSYARKAGIENAKYDYIIFCDDDNHLNPDYVEISFKKMEENKKAGAMGGVSEAISNVPFPEWFEKFQRNYSAGKQSEIPGDITSDLNGLWGAGMVVRKSAIEELYKKGYNSILTDRTKRTLSSGGDIELCYALRLAGWKIFYEPSLKLRHFIPASRLSWNYLRKLNRGFGAQKVGLDPYVMAFGSASENLNAGRSDTWLSQAFRLFKKIRKHGIRKLMNINNSEEGDPKILSMEKTLGRLKEILKIRGE